MNNTHLIAVFAENKPGQTARITRILAEAGVNIYWVTIANNGSFGVMKFMVDKPEEAVRKLEECGLMASRLQVLAVEVPNKPGGLQGVAEALGKENLNLDNCSGFVANDRAILIIEANDLARAGKVLEAQHLRLLTLQDMIKL